MSMKFCEKEINNIKQDLNESEVILKILLLALDNKSSPPDYHDINGTLLYIYQKVRAINIIIGSKDGKPKVVKLVK